MSWIGDRLRTLFRAQGSNDLGSPSGFTYPQQWLIDALGGSATASSVKVDWHTALQSVPIFACVSILSQDVAKLPIRLYRVDRQGRGREEDKTHPIARLLGQSPNRWMTPFDFKAAMVSQLALNGNAVAIVRRDQFGRAQELIPVDSPRVAPWFQDGELFYYISFSNELHRQTFGTSGALFPQADVIHVKWPIAWQGLWALSPVVMNREAIGNAIATDRYVGHLYSNNADIGGVLSHPGKLSDTARDRLRKSWESRYSGLANRARTAILEEGMVFSKMAMTGEEAQLILNRKFSVLEACRIYRMPPYKLADLDRTIASNIEEQASSYCDDTLVPIIKNFEDEYTRKLLVAREPTYIDIEHDVTAFVRARAADRYHIYQLAIEHGIMNANECRIMEGMPTRKGGDEYFFSNNMQRELEPSLPAPAQQAQQQQQGSQLANALLKGMVDRREAKRPNGHADG